MNSFTDQNESLNIWPSFADIAFCAMVVFLIYVLFLISVPQKVIVGEMDTNTAGFVSGSAQLPASAYSSLDTLYYKIVSGEHKEKWDSDPSWIIVVAGHTDNDLLKPGNPYINNWGLSSARAQSVVNYFVDVKHIDPKRIRAIGYGEHKPEAENTTFANKSRNRRIEVFLMKSDGNI